MRGEKGKCFGCGRLIARREPLLARAWIGGTLYEIVRVCGRCWQLALERGRMKVVHDDEEFELEAATRKEVGAEQPG